MKLNFKQRNILLGTILMWPMMGIFLVSLTNLLENDFFPEITGFGRFALFALAGLLFSVIIVALIPVVYPLSRNQYAIMLELEQNGQTQRFIELTEQEINRLITTGKAYKHYQFFSQYVSLQADAFLMQHNPQAAIQSINRINLQDLQIYTGKVLADQQILGYFDVQMAIAEELCNADMANAVMRDAAPYLQKVNEKKLGHFIIANEVYFCYYMATGNYAKAYEHARKYFEHSANRFCSFLGNSCSVKVFIKTGQFTEAERFLQNAEHQTTSTPNQRQILAYLRESLNRARAGM